MKRYIPAPEEIPSGICECGCGLTTEIVKQGSQNNSKRRFLGYPGPYRRGHSPTRFGKGPEAKAWKGGRYLHKSGYYYVYAPEHPNANSDGHILEHRLVVSNILGRPLEPGEVVHHINHDKGDNRPENLALMKWGDHSTLHAPHRVYDSEKMSRAGKKGADARWSKR
jgi:hypothetical protein